VGALEKIGSKQKKMLTVLKTDMVVLKRRFVEHEANKKLLEF